MDAEAGWFLSRVILIKDGCKESTRQGRPKKDVFIRDESIRDATVSMDRVVTGTKQRLVMSGIGRQGSTEWI